MASTNNNYKSFVVKQMIKCQCAYRRQNATCT